MSKRKKIPVPEPKPDEYEFPSDSGGALPGTVPNLPEDMNRSDPYDSAVPYQTKKA